jgi:hypothetical protein
VCFLHVGEVWARKVRVPGRPAWDLSHFGSFLYHVFLQSLLTQNFLHLLEVSKLCMELSANL